MKLSLEEAQAICSIRENRDFKVFMCAIANHCSNENERHIKSLEGSEFLRGQIFALSDLLHDINNAANIVVKKQRPKT